MERASAFFSNLLGLTQAPQELRLDQMVVRAVIVCAGLLLTMRVVGRRFLAQRNPFDVLLGFILASTISRAINGSAAFFSTMATGFVIAGIYRVLAWAACRYHALGRFLKGAPVVLVENGVVRRGALARHHISENDLREDLRLIAGITDLQDVNLAQLERNGQVSVQCRPRVTG